VVNGGVRLGDKTSAMDVPTRGLVGLPQGMVANVITATVGEMVVDEIQMSRAEARSPRKNIAAIEMTFFVTPTTRALGLPAGRQSTATKSS